MVKLEEPNPFQNDGQFGFDRKLLAQNFGQEAMVHLKIGVCDVSNEVLIDSALENYPQLKEWLLKNQRELSIVPDDQVGLYNLGAGDPVKNCCCVYISLPKGHGVDTGLDSFGRVSDAAVHEALEFLYSIEPDPEELLSSEERRSVMAQHQGEIDKAYLVLRKYAEQIEPKTIEAMQEAYYSFTNSVRQRQTPLQVSVVSTRLSDAWNGIGPWAS